MLHDLRRYLDNDALLRDTISDTSAQRVLERNEMINQMSMLLVELPQIMADLRQKLVSAQALQSAELELMEATMKKCKKTNHQWTTVTRKPRKVNKKQRQNDQVAVGDASMHAVTVASFDQVLPDGRLYYIPCADQFAFLLEHILFHGNIGNMTDNNLKVKDCKYGPQCQHRETCRYYHDPTAGPAREYRNFTMHSWSYLPQSSANRARLRDQCRLVASRDNLAMDLAAVDAVNANRACDQAMHDLLCAILMKQSLVD